MAESADQIDVAIESDRFSAAFEFKLEHAFSGASLTPWSDHLVCSAELGETWSMMELSVWHVSQGKEELALMWLECMMRVQIDMCMLTAESLSLGTSTLCTFVDEYVHSGQRIARMKLLRAIAQSSNRPTIDYNSQMSVLTFPETNRAEGRLPFVIRDLTQRAYGDVQRWAGRALISHNVSDSVLTCKSHTFHLAARGLWGGVLSFAGALQVIRRLPIQSLPINDCMKQAVMIVVVSDLEETQRHFAQAVRRATWIYWTLSLNRHHRFIPSPPNGVLDAVHIFAAANLLDEEIFQLAVRVMCRWAKALDFVRTGRPHPPVGPNLKTYGELRDDVPHILWCSTHWKVLYKPAMWAVSWSVQITSDFSKVERHWVESQKSLGQFAPLDCDLDPFGPVSQPAKSCDLLHWLLRSPKGLHTIQTDRCLSYGLSHRLDAQTSGPLVIARSYWGWAWIQLQFRAKRVMKRYICLCHGRVEPASGKLICWPLVRRSIPGRLSMRSVISRGGMRAVTEIAAVAHFLGPPRYHGKDPQIVAINSSSEHRIYSLVEIRLWTGRLHQIRVHMAAEGHPLVSDAMYGGGRLCWCPRFFLHCFLIGVPSGVNQDHVKINCQLPGDLRHVLRKMEACDHASHDLLNSWLGCGGDPFTDGFLVTRLVDGRWHGRIVRAIDKIQKLPGLVRFKSNDRVYTIPIAFHDCSCASGTIVHFQVVGRRTNAHAIDVRAYLM